jgi:hypothetical protein
MFDLNFIAEPGIQTENSDDCWSFLHKRKTNEEEIAQKKTIVETQTTGPMSKYYTWVICAILLIVGVILYNKPRQSVSPDMVLNQVVDLIIESGYMKDLQLAEAHFMPRSAIVTIAAHQLTSIQEFIMGYRREDNIPFKIFQKNNMSYVSLNFPWDGGDKGGDMEALKSLAAKTVFSNKISINYTDHYFELQGRSSDIISYLLQMAETGLIQKFTLSVLHLESGRFFLKVQVNET